MYICIPGNSSNSLHIQYHYIGDLIYPKNLKFVDGDYVRTQELSSKGNFPEGKIFHGFEVPSHHGGSPEGGTFPRHVHQILTRKLQDFTGSPWVNSIKFMGIT